MSVAESGEGGARVRIIISPRGDGGGGRSYRGDDGRVTDEEGGREVESAVIEIPLPTPRHKGGFTMYGVAKQDIIGAPLILKRLVPSPGYSRNEAGGGAHDFFASVMEAVHLVTRIDADGASSGGRCGDDTSKP